MRDRSENRDKQLWACARAGLCPLQDCSNATHIDKRTSAIPRPFSDWSMNYFSAAREVSHTIGKVAQSKALTWLVLGRIANFDDSIHDLHDLDEANNELNHDPNRELANHDL